MIIGENENDDREQARRFLERSRNNRLKEAVRRGIVLVRRVSSPRQAIDSVGSIESQKRSALHALEYGVPLEEIEFLDLLGESGTRRRERPGFLRLLERVGAGEIGVLIFSDGDRASRNDKQFQELLYAMMAHHGFFIVAGRLYDLQNPHDRAALGFVSITAELDADHRYNRNNAAFFEKVVKAGVAFALPTPLVWGSLKDSLLVEALCRENLDWWISPDRIAAIRTTVSRSGDPLYPVPYPCAEVVAAASLCLDVYSATGSVDEVIDALQSDPRNPRPGHYPVIRGVMFSGRMKPSWASVLRHKRDPTSCRVHLRRWLKSAALFGTYEIEVTIEPGCPPYTEPVKETVSMPNAFPSFRPHHDRETFVRKLAGDCKIGHRYKGIRNHFLDPVNGVVCADRLPDGRPCGLILVPGYLSQFGLESYYNVACARRHGFAPGAPARLVEAVVIGAVLERLSPPVLRGFLEGLTRNAEAHAEEVKSLRVQVATARLEIERTYECERESDDEEDRSHWRRQRKPLLARRAELEARLGEALEKSEEANSVEENELDRLASLAVDLKTLLRRAEPIEGLVREILRPFVTGVRVRNLARFTYQIEVEFPGGGRVREVRFCKSTAATQPMCAFAYARLADHLPRWIAEGDADTGVVIHAAAEEVARRFESHTAPLRVYSKWTARRVMAAALMQMYSAPACGREGAHESLEALAMRLELPLEAIEREALLGGFGPARVEGEVILVKPTETELHRRLPEAGRRWAAAKMGWPVEETVPIRLYAERMALSWHAVRRMAEKADALALDEAGWVYVRESRLPLREELTLGYHLDGAGPPVSELDRSCWVDLGSATREFPGICGQALRAAAPAIQPGFGPAGPNSWFVWLGPEVRRRLAPVPVEEAVAALGEEDLQPSEFRRIPEVLATLRRAYPRLTREMVTYAVRLRRVLSVRAMPDGPVPVLFIHLPQEVASTNDQTVIKRWLRGGRASSEGQP